MPTFRCVSNQSLYEPTGYGCNILCPPCHVCLVITPGVVFVSPLHSCGGCRQQLLTLLWRYVLPMHAPNDWSRSWTSRGKLAGWLQLTGRSTETQLSDPTLICCVTAAGRRLTVKQLRCAAKQQCGRRGWQHSMPAGWLQCRVSWMHEAQPLRTPMQHWQQHGWRLLT